MEVMARKERSNERHHIGMFISRGGEFDKNALPQLIGRGVSHSDDFVWQNMGLSRP